MQSLLIENQYFGTVSYYKILFQYRYIKIEQCELYQKASFRNRCVIPGSNGLIHLSVPLQKGRDQKAFFKEVQIAYKTNWVIQHCRSMDACYNRAPFFEYYRDELYEILEEREPSLFKLNWNLMHWIFKKLKYLPEMELTDQYIQNPDQGIRDARNLILPGKDLGGIQVNRYAQVFEDRIGFQSPCSVLDILFNLGPSAIDWLRDSNNQF
jgi:hypothetical protein